MNTTKRFLIAIVLCFAIPASFYFSSCTKDKTVPVIIDTSCTHNGTDTISYINDVAAILTTYCTSNSFGDCHGTNSSYGYDFTSYDLLQPYVDGKDQSIMYDYVFGATSTMPKSISLGPTVMESCDKEKLYYWLLQGAPNN